MNDADVIIHFVSKENLEILNSLVQDIKYILANDLEKKFESNSFEFDPVLNGCISEQAWIESAYKTPIAGIR